MSSFCIENIRRDFPFFSHSSTVYLDSAATSQTPQVVIDSQLNYYTQQKANVHRGSYQLSEQVTRQYEEARETIADFIGAQAKEIVFTSGATHGFNFLAQTLGQKLSEGDCLLLSELEHHANIIPWQQIAQSVGVTIKYIPLNKQGQLDIAGVTALIEQDRPKIVSISYASNALGNKIPFNSIFEAARNIGATTILDAAQAVLHERLRVNDLDCDFLVFSGHKMLGPTGTGVVWGRYQLLDNLPTWQTGGGMIRQVKHNESDFLSAPQKFEPGTPNIAGVIGLKAAAEYLMSLDYVAKQQYETKLFEYLLRELQAIPEVKIYGDISNNLGNLSFNIEGEHHYDVAVLLDQYNIAVRAGHHCCQLAMQAMDIPGTLRVSLAFYNTQHDIDQFINALKQVVAFLNE